jgi:hypothetical protein
VSTYVESAPELKHEHGPPEPAGPAQRLGEGTARGVAVVVGLTILSGSWAWSARWCFRRPSARAAAHVLVKQPDQILQLIEAFLLFAPGIAGTAVVANLSRVMFVIGRLKVAAVALAGSWVITIVVDVVLVELVPARLVVAALALGTTIGQGAAAIPLVFVTRRICGPAAVQGARHAPLAGLVACALGAAVGVAVGLAVPLHHKLVAVAVAFPAAGCVGRWPSCGRNPRHHPAIVQNHSFNPARNGMLGYVIAASQRLLWLLCPARSGEAGRAGVQ